MANRRRRRKKYNRRNEIAGIILMALGLILLVGLFLTPVSAEGLGVAGFFLTAFLRFLAGSAAVSIPLLMIFWGLGAVAAGEQIPLGDRLAQIAPISGAAPADGSPVCVPLPREVIAGTVRGFADLRLFDELGRETPYAVFLETAERQPSNRFVFAVIDFDPRTNTMILERDRDAAGDYDRLELRTLTRDFRKTVRASGSDDRQNWRELSQENIFAFSAPANFSKTSMELPNNRCRFIRLELSDETPAPVSANVSLKYQGLEFQAGGESNPLKIERVEGWVEARETWESTLDQTTILNPPQRQDKDRITWIELVELNLPIAEMELAVTNPYFQRRVEVQTADRNLPEVFRTAMSGTIYRIPGMDKANMELRTGLPQQRWLRLRIADGDNPPLAVDSVTLRWTRRNLYFVPEARRRYELRFTGSDVEPPRYDLAVLLPAAQSELRGLDKWQVDEIRSNPRHRPPMEKPAGRLGQEALYAILAVLTIGLGIWLYNLARKLPPPSDAPET